MGMFQTGEREVACRHGVFTNEERLEYKRNYEVLQTRRVGVAELENGYQYQFQGDPETLRLINEWVSLERKCCPFLAFTVIARSEDEPIFLQVTGSGEAKSFLRSNVQSAIQTITTMSES